MPSLDPRPLGRKVTLPQALALVAIWTAVVYGLASQNASNAEQISLKAKPAVTTCAKQG